MLPICATCGKEMSISKVGVCVVYYLRDGNPYYLVRGDAVSCPKCKNTVVVRFGKKKEHYQLGFEHELQAALANEANPPIIAREG